MQLIIQKFGGTSLSNVKNIKNVATIIKSEHSKGNNVIIVVSAMAGTTNQLKYQCSKISNLDNISAMREHDAAVASGEILTASLLALELQNSNLKAQSVQGWQIPIYTNNSHGNSQVLKVIPDKLKNMINNNIIPIITGFQGVTKTGDITTLGKGGSDISAALIAASLKATRCDIYTDVKGVYSADPRVVHDAHKINTIDIDQLSVLCSYGAKILHPRAAILAKNHDFQLRILSSFSKNQGTNIIKQTQPMEKPNIIAITSNKNLIKIIIKYNKLNLVDLLNQFTQQSIEIYQADNLKDYNNISIIVNLTDQNKCKLVLEEYNKMGITKFYSLNTNISMLTIVGDGMKNDYNMIKDINQTLNDNKINISSFNIDDLKITLIINDQDNEQAIKLLYKKFWPNKHLLYK